MLNKVATTFGLLVQRFDTHSSIQAVDGQFKSQDIIKNINRARFWLLGNSDVCIKEVVVEMNTKEI